MTDIARMRGIGPKSALWLAAVEIRTEADLRALGAVAAYRRVKHYEPQRVSLNMLWGLHAALVGIPWTAVDTETKQRLLREFDASAQCGNSIPISR